MRICSVTPRIKAMKNAWSSKSPFSIIVIGALILSMIPPARAANRRDLLIANVGITAGLTLFGAWLEGNVEDWPTAFKTFGYGGLGGYGFYEAKELAGKDKIGAGMVLTWASASLVENVKDGEHPLAYARYGLGPIDLRIATPWVKDKKASVLVDFNVPQAASFAIALSKGENPGIRYGNFYSLSDDSLGKIDGTNFDIGASTYGRSLVFSPGQDRFQELWQHESVHVMQAVQLGAVSYEPFRNYFIDKKKSAGNAPFIRFGGVKIESFNVGFRLAEGEQAYADQWTEIEAYRIANDRPPPE